jgi:hypothetical protein
VNAPVRFSTGFARVRAMRSRLWTPLDRALLLRAGLEPGGAPLSGELAVVLPRLIGWYVVVDKVYPAARPLTACLLRLHEIENVKLLWRAAIRGRQPPRECWRPLDPRATVRYVDRALTAAGLIRHLARTPYAAVAHALMRSHPSDLPAAETGLDRWAWLALDAEAARLPRRERAAADLVRLLVIEHDLDLLRRGAGFGLEADLVAKATIVLSSLHGVRALAPLAAWTPAAGPLHASMPPRLAARLGAPGGWDEAIRRIRRERVRACRRAFLGWPYQLAPAIALLLLREAQAAAALSLAAARALPPDRDSLAVALARGVLEA